VLLLGGGETAVEVGQPRVALEVGQRAIQRGAVDLVSPAGETAVGLGGWGELSKSSRSPAMGNALLSN